MPVDVNYLRGAVAENLVEYVLTVSIPVEFTRVVASAHGSILPTSDWDVPRSVTPSISHRAAAAGTILKSFHVERPAYGAPKACRGDHEGRSASSHRRKDRNRR